MPSKKIKQLERAFDREIRRLEKLVEVAKLKGVKFDLPPIPRKPATVTQEALDIVKSITPGDILSGKPAPEIPSLYQKPLPQPETESHRRRKRKDEYMRHSRVKGPEKPYEKLSPEEYARIRKEAARKAAETRRQREASDPEFKARMDAIRRANIAKARAAKQPQEAKPPKPKKTPEELKAIRQASAKKALAARREKEANDPEYKARMDEKRRASLLKARAAKKAKNPEKKPPKPKKTAEELKKIRSAAAKKAAETRRKREESDPEYKKRMDEIRRENLKKAREAKYYKKIDKDEDFDPFTSEQYFPTEDELIFDGFEERMGASNGDIFDVVYDAIKDIIDKNGRSEILYRFKMLGSDVLDEVDSVLNLPYDYKVYETSMHILGVLFNGQVPADIQTKLEDSIQKSIENKRVIKTWQYQALLDYTHGEI